MSKANRAQSGYAGHVPIRYIVNMSDDDFPLTPGYRLNSATVLRDLHRLLSAFLAYSPIRDLADGESDPLTMLQERFTEDEKVDLEFREACNKIIHAQSVEIFDPDKPVLWLRGKLGRKEWLAFVEVIDYVRASAKNFEDSFA